MSSRKAKQIYIFIAIGVLYFAGISAILYPMVSNIISLSSSKTSITDYVDTVRNLPDDKIYQMKEDARKHNENLANGKFDDGLDTSLCDSNGVLGYVDVPSIGVYLPIYYEATDDNLAKGCAVLKNTSLPVGGESTHSVISAHTGLPTAEMFTKLDQVKEGEVFHIHVLDETLAYKVIGIYTVSPDITKKLEIVRGKDYCTLLTCTPYGINDKRLLVRGERVPYEPEENPTEQTVSESTDNAADEGLRQEIRHQITIVAGIVIVSIIVYIFALIWLMRSLRSAAKEEPEEENGVDEETD